MHSLIKLAVRAARKTARTFVVAAMAAALTAVPAAAQEVLRPGSTTSGELSAADARLDSGEFQDTYAYQGRAGERLVVRLSSTEFDPYLMIRGPGGLSQDNDDAPDGGLNSLLDVRLPADGVYLITATSYEPGERGRYRLELTSGGQGGGAQAPAAQGGELSPGRPVSGDLGRGDDTLSSGEYADSWSLRVRAGQRYIATLRSADFDTYLMVRGGGLQEDNDDDPGARGSTNSRLEFTAPASGMVQVIATSYRPGERGRYQLAVETAHDRTQTRPPSGGAELTFGRPVAGRLAAGDRQLRSGEYLNAWTLRGRRGEQVELRMTSSELDPYLMISGPGGLSAENDDDPDGGTNSRLVVTLPADGDYEVIATSYAPGETGRYSLSAARVSGLAESVPTTGAGGAGDLIGVGESRTGALRPGDDILASGEYADWYRIIGRRGERVSIEATSSEFDTYLMLTQPDGEQIDNDDAPGTTDSRIDMVFPADGEYALGVTSFAPGETGAYRVSVSPSQGTARQASVQGGPRVFAVVVGVSDYGGTANDLAYTDEDAEKLAEALDRNGLLNPASVVLTNGGATVASVRQAFARVAAQAGPEDTFLFFFSGHGVQHDTPVSAAEPDGRMETIVLRDGEITDAELGQMFATLDTRLALVVIDACFSGGFARNVVNRPGVMGLFSSEEDLTSSVADKFEAGGYLSHFLRAGLSGDADIDGDGLVTAGELSTYLRRQFARDVEAEGVTAETTDGQRGYQHLVVDRGGVQVDDVIVRLGPQAGGRALGGR